MVLMAPMDRTAEMARMEAMDNQEGTGEMPAISMPWLPTATLPHTTLSLVAAEAASEEKPAMAEQEVTAEMGPMAAMELPAAVKLEQEEILAPAAEAVMPVLVAMAARGEQEAMEPQLRFRFPSTAPQLGLTPVDLEAWGVAALQGA
jgi:hypothetical protein